MGLGECGYEGCTKRVQQTDRRHFRCKPCEKLHWKKLEDSRCGKTGHEYSTMLGYSCLDCKLEDHDKYKKALEEIAEYGSTGEDARDMHQIAREALK